ncbi:type II toxin-antitoxin system HicB family antitoxin [Flagellimonas sp. C4]|uniref:type II toxin-antitoxin system HicB family antitoxin n=1 Tax=Flagellimonas alginolytica TaxID=3177515 RepID=UPI0035C93348
MADNLEHEGYFGSVEYSSRDGLLHGKIIGINDLVSYEGGSVEELKKAFEESVEDYLETCKELGKEPNRFYRGVFNIRTSSEIHRKLSIMAEREKMKLNELVNKAFDYLVKNEDKVLNQNKVEQ